MAQSNIKQKMNAWNAAQKRVVQARIDAVVEALQDGDPCRSGQRDFVMTRNVAGEAGMPYAGTCSLWESTSGVFVYAHDGGGGLDELPAICSFPRPVEPFNPVATTGRDIGARRIEVEIDGW